MHSLYSEVSHDYNYALENRNITRGTEIREAHFKETWHLDQAREAYQLKRITNTHIGEM